MNEDERKLAEALGIDSDDEDLDHNIRTSQEFKNPLNAKNQSTTPKMETVGMFGKKVSDMLGHSVDVKKSRTDSPEMPARRQTYQRLFEERQASGRNVSRRWTGVMMPDSADHYHMDPQSLLASMFPAEVRKQKMLSYAKWGLINLLLFGYLMIFIVIFWHDWSYTDTGNCIADLSWWVLIYLII